MDYMNDLHSKISVKYFFVFEVKACLMNTKFKRTAFI